MSIPFVRPAACWAPYYQAEPPGASFSWLLKQDEIPGLTIGQVTLHGPIHKSPATHDDWEQVYLILSGSGMVHLNDRSHNVCGACVVVIPKGTLHSVEVKDGDELKYVYINQHR
jgi:mannose-6-phosphate isomerase-like protein (cupin superfamily)